MPTDAGNDMPPSVKPPINWKTNLWVAWLSQLLTLAGFAAVMPFIPIYFRVRFGMDDEQTRGLWVAIFNFVGMLSFCFAAPLWGWMADRYGRKLMLLRANYVSAVLLPCLALAPDVGTMIVIRLLVSSFSGTGSAAQTLIVSTTPEKHHGFALGLLSSAMWSGNTIGYALGGLVVSYWGFNAAFILCGVMYVIGGLLVHLFVREDFVRPTLFTPVPEVNEDTSISGRLKRASVRLQAKVPKGFGRGVWYLLGFTVLVAAARRFDEPYVAMRVENLHGHDGAAFYTGVISACAAVGGVISALAMGRLCDRYAPSRVALPSLLFSGLALLGQGLAASLGLFGATRFAYYLAAGGLEPSLQTALSRSCPPEKRGLLFGWASSLRMVGVLAGTGLGGAVIYYFGTEAVFLAAGAAFFLLIPWLFFVMRRAASGGSAH